MSRASDSGEPADGFVSKRSVRLQRAFPMVAVVGMDNIKQALLLGACDTGARCPGILFTVTPIREVRLCCTIAY